MEYEILSFDDVLDLETEVMKFIDLGWRPQGGVAVSSYFNHNEEEKRVMFLQAMVRGG